jgi:hypothetical protein
MLFRSSRPRALALVGLLCGCSPTASSSDARITLNAHAHAHQGKAEIVFGARKVELPADDVREVPIVMQDASGRRLAYRTASGSARVLYVVGESLFVGPLVPHPPDFRAMPDLDHAMGPLFETSRARRKELVREVRRERGEAGVVRLLIDAAYVDDPEWEETKRTLEPASEAALRDAFADGLERGKSAVHRRRATRLLDLKAPERAKLIAARAQELVDASQEPRIAGALLRVVIGNDKTEAAAMGCSVLSKRPSPKPDDWDKLVEAATLAIVVAGASCRGDSIESVLSDPCRPYYRCGATGPVSWSEPSNQDEPLCTKDDLTKAIATELERTTSDVLDSGTSRPGLFAYAALAARGSVPDAFVAAHARRRFSITQLSSPACDSGLAPGTPCHCDEPLLRHAACRSTSSKVANGVCRFVVEDQKIQSVVAEPGGT